MKPSSRIMWAALNQNNTVVVWRGTPVLCETKREAEVKSPVGKAVKVLVNITPT